MQMGIKIPPPPPARLRGGGKRRLTSIELNNNALGISLYTYTLKQ